MTEPSEILQLNAASTRRLEMLIASLSADDFQCSLGGGWTIATALTHVAFWDFRQTAAFAHYAETGALPDEDPATNPALEATARAIDPDAIGALVVEAAKQVDAAVAAANPNVFAKLPSGDPAFPVERFNHREEHIRQIAAALE